MEMLSDASSTLAISTIEIKIGQKAYFYFYKWNERVELDEHVREASLSSGAASRTWPRRPKGEASGGRLRSRMWAEPSPPRTKKSCPGRVGLFLFLCGAWPSQLEGEALDGRLRSRMRT